MADDRAVELAAKIRDAGHIVTLNGEVTTTTAAAVCGRSVGTLRNWRSDGRGPAWRRRLGRCWYSVDDLARFLAEQS